MSRKYAGIVKKHSLQHRYAKKYQLHGKRMPDFHPFGGRVSRHFGDSLAPDDAYLSYYDVRVTKGDVDAIKHDWLTDSAISFWEEFLEREYLKDYTRAKIVLLRPSMSFMLMQTPDPLTLREALPQFDKISHIFLPINNNADVNLAEGGSHWSLLLVSRIDGVAFHYDSLGNDNEAYAHHVTKQASKLLGKPLRFVHMRDSPQQDNGSDCGVFVCILMQRLLMERLLRSDTDQKVSMSMRGEHLNARDGRKEMLAQIERFRKEGERRRSRSASPFKRHDHTRSRTPPRVGEENA